MPPSENQTHQAARDQAFWGAIRAAVRCGPAGEPCFTAAGFFFAYQPCWKPLLGVNVHSSSGQKHKVKKLLILARG